MDAKLVGWLVFIGFIPVWVAIGVSLYWLTWPITPIMQIDGPPIEVVSAARPGGTVARELTFLVHRDARIDVSRRLVQTHCSKCVIYELAQNVKKYREGRYTQVRGVVIPDYVPPGTYRVEADVHWQENPLRRGEQPLPVWNITVKE